MPDFFLLIVSGCLSQTDVDITEINKLTAEAIKTPLKSVKSEYFFLLYNFICICLWCVGGCVWAEVDIGCLSL